MTGSPRIGILHVINSFEIGGAEVLLLGFANEFRSGTFQLMMAYLIGNGTLLRNAGCESPVYDLSRNGRFSLGSFTRLYRIIRTHNVRIVHTHDPQSGIIARCAAYAAGVRCVVTTRHNPLLIGRQPLVYMLENWFLKRATRVIAISDAVRNTLAEERIVSGPKVVVIHNGVDTKYFKPSDFPHPQPSQVIIGSVGRLTEQKGFDVLIAAVARIAPRRPELRLHIAGSGPLEGKLRQIIREASLESVVVLRGGLTRDGIKEFLGEIDIFVLASRWEGFGLSLVEAMAMAKPVIGSAVDGIVEIVNDGANGCLFPQGDSAALADKLEFLLAHREVRETLSRNARATAVEKFSIESFARKTEELYASLVGHSSGSIDSTTT